MEECMGCIVKDAEVEICLADGHLLYSCLDCIVLVIQENAYTDNPVHAINSMSPYEKQPKRGEQVFCGSCGRLDSLWYCLGPQPCDDGSSRGQYLWKWTECCGKFMILNPATKEINHAVEKG